jgi:hypothetical protein
MSGKYSSEALKGMSPKRTEQAVRFDKLMGAA